MLALAVAWAAFTGGGDRQFDSSVSLLLVGLAGIAGARQVSRAGQPRDALLTGAAILLPVYVALQLVPFPLALIRLLSPARAALADALSQVGAAQAFTPITISVPTTWNALARVLGCTTVFFVVRAAAGSPQRRWLAAAPLIAVGAVVAVSALVETPIAGGFTAGAYANRNHFANFNATILPMAIGYAAVLLYRGRQKGGGHVLMATLLLAAAAAMFVAVLFSWSKGGTLALLASLLAMAAIGLGRRISTRARVGLGAAAALLLVVFMVFLTPGGLVERFAVLMTNDPTEGRVPIWKDAVHLIAAYPLVGVGLGNFYPALLPFQTYGLELAWVNAHNDYLQTISELGFVGALIPACLLGVAFWRAVRTAVSDGPQEIRFLGLACAGAITAFLVHAVSEFHSYVLSNALVLSWIAGAAAGLRAPDARHFAGAPHRSMQGFALMPVLLVLGSLSVASSVGWFAFLQSYQDDPRAERAFCRFGICNSIAAIETLRSGDDLEIDYPVPGVDLVDYLRRDPAAPDRWEDLGEALQREGRTADARVAFDQAVRLAPRTPSTLLMAADFRFDIGEPQPAVALLSRSLREGADIDRAAFSVLDYRKVPIADRLNAIPDLRSAQAHFQWLFDKAGPADLATAWNWMLTHKYASQPLAARYVDFMIGQGEPAAAARGWTDYLAGTGAGYEHGDAIFNGSFESEPTGNRFDWRIDRVVGVSADFDAGEKMSGERSLRLRFDGKKNPGELGVQQAAFVAAGRYRFHAFVRTAGITTDQGPHFRIVSESAPGVSVESENLRGSMGWTPVECLFDVPPGGELLRVSLARTTSLKFDSNISGTAWVDAVTLTRVAP